jgi:RNA polymerase sigma factor (sigma-70 family)
MRGSSIEMTAADLHDGGTDGVPDDKELLDRFLGLDEGASEQAFQAMVARHGPMVLGVCRQTLGRIHDAEDAFQAIFLVLARRAGSIRNRKALGAWLHEVAYRTAVRARSRAAQRRRREMEVANMSTGADTPEWAWGDLGPVLHEEIHRLPETYRSAVVLCYLEGRTNEEAAALLRWPVGTVKGRLSRARDLLRGRLSRRGLALVAVLLMTRLTQGLAAAEVVPPALTEATVLGALAMARGAPAGAAITSTRVLELVNDELGVRPGPTGLGGGRAFWWLLVAAAVLISVSAASGQGPGPLLRLVAGRLIPASVGPGTGGCHHAVSPIPGRPG